MKNYDIKELIGSNILIVTFWEQIRDTKDFVENLFNYFHEIGQENKIDKGSIEGLHYFKYFLRNMRGQSLKLKKNIIDFLEYNKDKICRNWNEKIYSKIKDLISKSCSNRLVPFSFEKFIQLLSEESEIPEDLKKQIWNRSCSLYYEEGAIGNYCVRYPIFEVDTGAVKIKKYENTFSIFFHPDFLEIFICALGISKSRSYLIGKLTAKEIVQLREENEFKKFKTTYHEMVASLSSELEKKYVERKKVTEDLDTAFSIFRKNLIFKASNKTEFLPDLLKSMVDIIFIFTEFASGMPGIHYASEKLKLTEKLENWIIKLKHEECNEFIKKLDFLLESKH